jgi:starch-binding outer membrane protein, SusD/RagB family
MNKLVSIISTALLCGLFTGCDKYLDLQPSQSVKDEVALTSDDNVKSVLRGAYSQFALPGIYGGGVLRNAELLGGDDELRWVGTYIDPRQLYLKTILTTNSEVEIHWRESYAVINTVNSILSAISVVNADDRDQVEGEALFLRSLMYFDLVRFFGEQYTPGQVNSQLGVPLILTPTGALDATNYVKRNTVEEVYSQVIADLKAAAGKMASAEDPVELTSVYATKGAANALLARVYLQKGDYANARDAADDVLTNEAYALRPTYASVFNNDNNSSEDIFATQITPQDRFSAMTEYFSVPEYGGRDGDIEILDGHLDLYAEGDKRFDLFFNGNGAIECGKWNNQYGVVNIIRLAEMYLIRAECNQRLGTAIGATPLADYNAIHTRAGLEAATSITLADILMERRLELAFEGFKIHDVRRLHLNVGTRPYNDPKLLYPIPAREIQANPGLKDQQNSGY